MFKKYFCKHSLHIYNKQYIEHYQEHYGSCYKISIPIVCLCLKCNYEKVIIMKYKSNTYHYDGNKLWIDIHKYQKSTVNNIHIKFLGQISKIIQKSESIDNAISSKSPYNIAKQLVEQIINKNL